MVSGYLKAPGSGAAALPLKITVTEAEFEDTFADLVLSRPAAATKPKETGAAYLSVGAAATLVAISLF